MVEYSPQLIDKMLLMVAAGKSINEICKRDDMPSQDGFYTWLSQNRDNLTEKYARARENQSEFYAQEMVNIAENCGLSAGEINKARLQIDTYKWIAAKLKPKKYGDNATMQHDVSDKLEQLIIQRTPKTIDHQPEVKSLPVINIDNDQD